MWPGSTDVLRVWAGACDVIAFVPINAVWEPWKRRWCGCRLSSYKVSLCRQDSEHWALSCGDGCGDEGEWGIREGYLGINMDRTAQWESTWDRGRELPWGFWLYKEWMVVFLSFADKITQEDTRSEDLCIELVLWIKSCWVPCHVQHFKSLSHYTHTVERVKSQLHSHESQGCWKVWGRKG